MELATARQRKDECVDDYIERWKNLSYQCEESLKEETSVNMCIRGMRLNLRCLLQAKPPENFDALATRAHNTEASIEDTGDERFFLDEPRREKKEVKKTFKGKEAMSINTAPLRIGSRAKSTALTTPD